jgi:hypothetical protein
LINLYLVCEDELSEVVMQKISKKIWADVELTYITIGKRGKGYIKNRINQFNNPNNPLPFFILTDLDANTCAPQLISKWLKGPCRLNLLFRIAVREVGSWLLADTKGISKYLNLDHNYIKKEVNIADNLSHPKEKLIVLVERSKKREIKKDIVRIKENRYKQGPAYNSRLIEYVEEFWDIEKATCKSDSLNRTIKALQKLKNINSQTQI